MLNAPVNVLKDFVQLMRLDLMPSLSQQQGFKWSVQFMLRIPPSAVPIVPIGMAGVLIYRNKILFFVSFVYSFSLIRLYINNYCSCKFQEWECNMQII